MRAYEKTLKKMNSSGLVANNNYADFHIFLPLTVHATEKPNILFIIIDDLGLDFGAYGLAIAHSPNLDRHESAS